MTRGLLFAATTALGFMLLAGCGDDNGKTPACPQLELYPIQDFSTDIPASAIQARDTAAAKGCVTAPGNATLPGNGGAAGGGGTTATGGAAGSGGSAGASAGTGGT